ncbi:carboxyl transferase domain-containing protein [Streptomyces sp. VRA16 Mangrove soil]|uniref:acetyl-CoA carboxylase family protein n=1 Tax=Streptomyces sp. VRA16 Mangrove soil TaxID=2817434 RepID=UPI001A9D783D|nr:carboxyl transferase domain-containing protein [Streptomyces sp. VRA16 Mangrove soil]MBO1332225.1 ATP-grasp domain-containing protein [Streptomyces sp. VRA16 Mangrove soil]
MGSAAVLVANRGEIAVRVLRAATDLGMRAVAVHEPGDDAHVRCADEAVPLAAGGYLDAAALVAAARRSGCGYLHPGYGFLSESAALARACAEAGVVFVGPSPQALELFGDKARARALAVEAGVPVLAGTDGATDLVRAREFLAGGPVMVKAVGGGGGRGMRVARTDAELTEAWERCSSDAQQAFGRGELYVERLWERARHIEVQVVADSAGAVGHLWERDCSAQRRHQKLVEVAPAPALDPAVRDRLLDAALRLAAAARCQGLGTVEFLVRGEEFVFIEANPRLQVEHTVTEEVTGVDLVAAQLRLAAGDSLADLGLDVPSPVRGVAVQVRVNAEVTAPDGAVRPSAGRITRYDVPTGPGIRVDTAARTGTEIGARYDSLLAKVVAHAPRGGFAAACARAGRALDEFAVEGVRTGIPLLRRLLEHPGFTEGGFDTGFVQRHLADLAPAAVAEAPQAAPGTVVAPMSGAVTAVEAVPGQLVASGAPLLILEAMKMEHVVRAECSGVVRAVHAEVGETVAEGAALVLLDVTEEGPARHESAEAVDPDAIRPDLAAALERHAFGLDANRPEAVAKRHAAGRRTARENIEELCDPGTFTEFGALAVAAQRQRRPLDELIRTTPADGMVTGTGRVGGAPAVVMSYDYTVLAGTQGHNNHRKTDRMLHVAQERGLPVVLFAEGGGGRPGDTDTAVIAGLNVPTFQRMARLSGRVPLVGIASGRCFAGNAALLGCCDVIIATPEANIGMGGPAMIEGGGLGVYRPEEVGPMSVQVPNGVVDLPVADEAEAVRAARAYLSYFQGPRASWEAPDQRLLRHAVPENRRRAYDMRAAIEGLADTGSVLELRRGFGVGVITALVRVEGRPLGLIANDPAHLGGAIDRDAADKAARFLRRCEASGLPVVSLCDTPGFMVGPDAERTATVRQFAELFIAGAGLSVPLVCLVLRKAYGLGAMAMMGGSTQAPLATAAWPSGEFGGMGLEGAVRLGYRRELAAIADPAERERAFRTRVAELYEHGRAVNAAAALEIDAVIDPAQSRGWLLAALGTAATPRER